MKPSLRILMPSIYFPPRVGGIESHVYYLSRELARRGHSVGVVTTRTEKNSPWKENMDGIEVTRLPSFGKHFVGWLMSSLISVPRVLLSARKCDVIHCHTFAFALGGGSAKALFGAPLVVTVHSSHFLRMARRKAMRAALRSVLKGADALLSTSKEIDSVVGNLIPGARTIPIVNGIDTDTFKLQDALIRKSGDEFLIVCPRRLVEKNGVEFLIRALAHLKGEVNARVHIAGDGPLRLALERLAGELNVRDQVVFMGSVDNNLMPAVYSSADLVVITSLIDATSIAALEAMACERVVAASRVGGLPEIIDDRVGLLFEPGSPEAIAETIKRVAHMEDTSAMGREARKRVEANWSISRITDIHEELYHELVRESGHA
jgi:glycosyltransferase involved in cell wall biosynthesis